MNTKGKPYLTDDDWIERVNEQLAEEWKHVSRVVRNDNKEVVEVFPNGDIRILVDKYGNNIADPVGYIEPGYEDKYRHDR